MSTRNLFRLGMLIGILVFVLPTAWHFLITYLSVAVAILAAIGIVGIILMIICQVAAERGWRRFKDAWK